MAVALSGMLFVAIFVLRLIFGPDTSQGITMLYALPVALLALALGVRGGVVAGMLAVVLVAAWVAIESVHLASVRPAPTGDPSLDSTLWVSRRHSRASPG